MWMACSYTGELVCGMGVGCIGILRDWVVDTVAGLMCKRGHTTLTIEALKIRPPTSPTSSSGNGGTHRGAQGRTGNATSHQQLQALPENR